MLGTAAPTAYDLRFRILDIPVRVHPLFWLVMAILASGSNDLSRILVFIGCAFISILVHEFGHGLMAKYFGYRPQEIVLYGMGGYCQCDLERQTPREQLAVLFLGPGAGFLLLGTTLLLGAVLFGITLDDDITLVRALFGLQMDRLPSPAFFRLAPVAQHIYFLMIEINLIWGLLNLLPIWPLDGGRISEVLFGLVNRGHGRRWAHVLSLLTAGMLAVIFLRAQQTFMAIWFAYFGFINYQVLQAISQSSRYRTYDDDGDWWKR